MTLRYSDALPAGIELDGTKPVEELFADLEQRWGDRDLEAAKLGIQTGDPRTADFSEEEMIDLVMQCAHAALCELLYRKEN